MCIDTKPLSLSFSYVHTLLEGGGGVPGTRKQLSYMLSWGGWVCHSMKCLLLHFRAGQLCYKSLIMATVSLNQSLKLNRPHSCVSIIINMKQRFVALGEVVDNLS